MRLLQRISRRRPPSPPVGSSDAVPGSPSSKEDVPSTGKVGAEGCAADGAAGGASVKQEIMEAVAVVDEEEEEEEMPPPPAKVYYATRTHSQLAQVIVGGRRKRFRGGSGAGIGWGPCVGTCGLLLTGRLRGAAGLAAALQHT